MNHPPSKLAKPIGRTQTTIDKKKPRHNDMTGEDDPERNVTVAIGRVNWL